MRSLRQVFNPIVKLHPHRQLASSATHPAVAFSPVMIETASEIKPRPGIFDQTLLAALKHLDIVGENHRRWRADIGEEADRAVKNLVRGAFETKAVDAHLSAVNREREGDPHVLLLRVEDEVGINDVVETVHAQDSGRAFHAKPRSQRRPVLRRYRILRLAGDDALFVKARHVGVSARQAIELYAFPFGGTEAVG